MVNWFEEFLTFASNFFVYHEGFCAIVAALTIIVTFVWIILYPYITFVILTCIEVVLVLIIIIYLVAKTNKKYKNKYK